VKYRRFHPVWYTVAFLLLAALSNEASAVTRYQMKDAGVLKFALPTSAGLIEGSLKIKKVELRGPDGWNPFKFRLVLDPKSFQSGDPLRDQYVVSQILKPHLGDFYLYSLDRIAPKWGADGQPVGDPRIKGFMDPVRKGAYVEIPYQWKGNHKGGVLRINHEANLTSLGIPKPGHPFVKIEGPIKINVLVELSRVKKDE